MVRASPNLMIDFKGIYYFTRCLLQHTDPYQPSEPLRIYLADGVNRPMPPNEPLQVLTLDEYTPTTFIFVAPFATLPWETAAVLWAMLGFGGIIVAAFLMWDLASCYAPAISCCLICFILANCEILFTIGNPAAIAISLCAVCVWCFLKDRFVWVGVLCLAASLAIKPHDAGFVWLYFLLAGAPYRKRALQTLAITAVIGLAAIAWVTPIAPHWVQEWHSNLIAISGHGGICDPGPAASNGRGPIMIIGLQSVVAVFRDDPRIYNSVSLLICGALLLIWAFRALRVLVSETNTYLALAAVAPLTLLVSYHRAHDSKLLLLAVPACAMLWASGRLIRWLGLLFTSAAIVFTADMPLTILKILTKNLHLSTTELSGQMLTVLVMWPAQLTLLAMGIFYLWIYVRHDPIQCYPGTDKGNR
jgi:hypothetical protein